MTNKGLVMDKKIFVRNLTLTKSEMKL